MNTAQDAIAAFLAHLHERGYAFSTRRLRGHYLTEYLEHATNTEGTPPDLAAADLMELQRADAWLEAAAAGELRRRNTLRGPAADAAEESQRSRIITYNQFADFLRTPWRLEVPPNPSGEHLDPDEAAHVIHKLAVQRPPTANEVTWIRTAALASLVAATGRTVRELAELDVSNLMLRQAPPVVVMEDGPVELDERTVSTLKRWLRQRQALVKRTLEGSDPGYLWLPTKEVGRPGQPEDAPYVPLGARRAAVRTLHAAHRRLVLSLLGHPVRLSELRPQHDVA